LAITQTLELETGVERFISAVARMETSTRNYLLSGDARYLDRVQSYRGQIRVALSQLTRLTAGDTAQSEWVLTLPPLMQRKFANDDEQLQARRERGIEASV